MRERGGKEGNEKIMKGLTDINGFLPNHIWKEDFLIFSTTNKVLEPEEKKLYWHHLMKKINRLKELG
jgi:hemerythrin-like domain-containing protein